MPALNQPLPLVLVALAAPAAFAQTASPGFALTEYAQVPTPAHLVAGADGALYVGNSDNTTAGAFPHRVAPGGAPVEPLSATRIYDPDGVALDVDGAISGVPGSVLVASIGSGGPGRIWAVRPGGAVDPLFSGAGWNAQEMVFDSAGRLLISEPTSQSVLVSAGAAPETLFTLPAPVAVVAVDANDRVYTCADDGVVRIHASAGAEIDPSYTTFAARAYIDLGRGSGFGAALYALDDTDGRIYRVGASGDRTEIARGFDVTATGHIRDIGFGADGALYIAYTAQSSIWRLTACGGDCDASGSLDFFDFLCFQDLFASGDPYADCDASGALDFFDFLCFQNAFAAGCP
jgi:hypothetical protein